MSELLRRRGFIDKITDVLPEYGASNLWRDVLPNYGANNLWRLIPFNAAYNRIFSQIHWRDSSMRYYGGAYEGTWNLEDLNDV